MTHPKIIPKIAAGSTISVDAVTLNGKPASYYLDCNNFINCPEIPSSLLDLGLVDGTPGQILSTDGQGNFVFINLPEQTNIDGGAATTVYSQSNTSFDGASA